MKLKSALKLSLKILVVVLLFYFLAKKGLISVDATQAAFQHLEYIIQAFLAFTATNFISIFRWHILLQALDIHLKIKKTIQLSFVGSFFNVALPGAVSGDVVKAVFVAKEVHGKRAHALSSILFDRLVGVSGLVLVSLASLVVSLFFPAERNQENIWAAVELVVGTAGVGVIVFFGYIFLVKKDQDKLLHFFKFLEAKAERMGSLTRIYDGIRTYGEQPKAVVLGLLFSMINHTLAILAFILFAKALGETQISSLALFIVVPLGLLITAIPVLPAGMGTGHAAFLALFHLLGSERGADCFNLYVLNSFFAGAQGGVVYLFFKSHLPNPSDHLSHSE